MPSVSFNRRTENGQRVVDVSNNDSRYVELVRRVAPISGTTPPYSVAASSLSGSIPLSWGSLWTGTGGNPTIGTDRAPEIGSGAELEYWVLGPGFQPPTVPVPDGVAALKDHRAQVETILFYAVFPTIDLMTGAFDAITGTGTTPEAGKLVTDVLWPQIQNTVSLSNLQRLDQAGDYLGAASAITDIATTVLSSALSTGAFGAAGSEWAGLASGAGWVLAAGSTFFASFTASNLAIALFQLPSATYYTIPAVTGPPTIALTANPTAVSLGQQSTLSWSATNSSSCVAAWTASTAVSGSMVVTPVATSIYSMNCAGPGGSASAQVTVSVTIPASPIVTTQPVSNVTPTGFRMNGTINPNGVSTSAFFEWGTNASLNTFNTSGPLNLGSGVSPIGLYSDVSGAVCGTTYYYRMAGNTATVLVRGSILSVTMSPCPASSRLFATSLGSVAGTIGLQSDLYSIDVSVQGFDRFIGHVTTAQNFQPAISDLALAPNRQLWAISFDRLYLIDSTSGIGTDIGPLGVADMNALAADRNGNLFGATISGQLMLINKQTGNATVIGSLGGGLVSSGDLAFGPDGRLFGAFLLPTGQGILATINLATGIATPVNSNLVIGFANVYGLSFVGSQLFGLTTDVGGQGTLITIDPSSGVGSRVRSLAFNASGAGLRSCINQCQSGSSGPTQRRNW